MLEMSNHLPVHYGRRHLLTLLAGSSVAMSGCFGGFALTRKLYGFNSGVSNKWIRWLVFLLFYVFLVYGVAVFIDSLVFNSIEFWTGKSPLSLQKRIPGEKGEEAVVSAPSEDELVIEIRDKKGAKVKKMALKRMNDAIWLESDDGQTFRVGEDPSGGKGSTRVSDKAGTALAHMSAQEWKKTEARLDSGMGPALAMQTLWLEQGPAIARR